MRSNFTYSSSDFNRLIHSVTKVAAILLLFSLSHWVSAQPQPIDSLEQLIRETPNDSIRAMAMNRLANLTKNVQPDSALQLALRAYKIGHKNGWKRVEGTSLLYVATMAMKKSKFEEARKNYDQSLELFVEIGDSLSAADVLQGIGNIYRRQRQYDEALRYYFRVVEMRENNGATAWSASSSYLNIANVYFFIKEYDKALEHYLKVLKSFKANNDLEGTIRVYNNIFAVLYTQEKYEESIEYLSKALHLSDSLNLKVFKAANLMNLGEVYKTLKRFSKSYDYTTQALQLYTELEDNSRKAMVLKNLGQLCRDMGDSPQAIRHYQESLELATAMDHKGNMQDAYLNLASEYAITGQYKNAYEAHLFSAQLKDSLFTQSSEKQLNELRTRFETEQKEQEIASLQAEQERSDREQKLMWMGMGLLALLAGIALLAMWQRKRTMQHLQKEEEQSRELLQEKENLIGQLVNSEQLASLGQLTAGIAHEINNPINFVASNTQALQRDFDELNELLLLISQLHEKQNQQPLIEKIIQQSKKVEIDVLRQEIDHLLKSIRQGTDRTINIVDSLRTFSRKTSEVFQEADIHQGIESALIILNSKIAGRVIIHRQYGELPMVNCQISKLNQVFLNIINNALQAMEENGELNILTSKLDNKIEIVIRDNGKGMDVATQNQIFEPFFTTKNVGQGTGLGLSISHNIIQHHQGSIHVDSKVGEGTSFIIQLPINPQFPS